MVFDAAAFFKKILIFWDKFLFAQTEKKRYNNYTSNYRQAIFTGGSIR